MKIKREFLGQIVEIELTAAELIAAYDEQSKMFLRAECAEYLRAECCEMDWYIDIASDKDTLAEAIDAMVVHYNHHRYYYGSSDFAAMDSALDYIIGCYEEE